MKSTRMILLFSVGSSIVIILGIMVFVLLNEGMNWILLGVMGASIVIVLVTTLPFLKALGGSGIKDGIPAEATILKMWDTGTSINDNPLVGFLLEVQPADQPAYQVETKKIIGRLQVGLLRPGLNAEVTVDRNNPQKVELKTIHAGEQAQQADPADRMEVLEELRTKHLVSEQEYEEKRQEILKSL